MHRLLTRQIRRHLNGEAPESLQAFLAAVDEAYTGFDADRSVCERSLDISSRELMARHEESTRRNAELQILKKELEVRVAERTRELRSANEQLKVDIAHRVQMEEALRNAEEKYRSIFQAASDGIFQTTADGRYLACNPALARIYGYASPEELIASVTDIAHKLYVEEESRPRFRKLMAEHGRVSGFEARVYRKDGSIIWISETARAVYNGNGTFMYYEGFVADITARKAAEDALRESEERYALAIRGANDGLWDWNLRTGLIHFSARWKEMLGCREEQVGNLLDEWFSRVHAEDLESLQAAIAAHRDGLTPHFEIEHRMRHADGGYRWMLSRGMAIRDAGGKALRMAGSQTDVTVRREAYSRCAA